MVEFGVFRAFVRACVYIERHWAGIPLQRSADVSVAVETQSAMFVLDPHIRCGCVRCYGPDLKTAERTPATDRGKKNEEKKGLLTCMNIDYVYLYMYTKIRISL